MTQDEFAANDAQDAARFYSLFLAAAHSALGVDLGAPAYDGPITNPVGQNQVLNISTGTAVQGQAATVRTTVLGQTFSLPLVLVLGAGAWWLLRR
ncbi:MAG: hypothetical protein NDJ19_00640 [Ramlibacter sp.]|nr:hypothetical protein [Ramlibacter sp.]